MQTILEILRLAGQLKPGFCLSIVNEPYMRLVIEDIQIPGPDGYPTLSVAHYGEQNGDAMRDPEMLFELVETLRPDPLGAVLLPQRLRRRRTVLAPESGRRGAGSPSAAARAPALRAPLGSEPPSTGLRGGVPADASRRGDPPIAAIRGWNRVFIAWHARTRAVRSRAAGSGIQPNGGVGGERTQRLPFSHFRRQSPCKRQA